MENPFKKIIYHQDLPQKLRERVLSDVAAIKLVLDIADLTMIKYPSPPDNLFNTTHRKKK